MTLSWVFFLCFTAYNHSGVFWLVLLCYFFFGTKLDRDDRRY